MTPTDAILPAGLALGTLCVGGYLLLRQLRGLWRA